MTNVSQTHSSVLITPLSSGTGKRDLLCPEWHESLQHGLYLAGSSKISPFVVISLFTLESYLDKLLISDFNDLSDQYKYVKR